MQKNNVLIIGSGAGAGMLAYKASALGAQVTVLEKGDWVDSNQNPEDELAEIQWERHRPWAEDDPTEVTRNGTLVSENSRVGQAFYLVGGGTVRYTATSWRLREKDFKKKSTYGSIPDSSLVDWPLSYDELEPFYTEAEKVIGISGLSGSDPSEPKRSFNHLMPPLREDRYQEILRGAAKKLGWHPFPIPVAIHSQASSDRGASECMQCGWCSGFPCRFLAKSSMSLVVYPQLAGSKHFTLKTNSYVTRIIYDKKHNKVRGAEYIDLKSGKTKSILADVVVIAASAIQSARLLLYSEIPDPSGLLGKNLMFHIEAKASATFENEKFHQAYYKKVGIHDFYYPQNSKDFINHRSLQSGSKAPPIALALSKKGFGKDFILDLKKNFLGTQELQAMCEDLPQEQNHISLSKTRKDPWGIPIPEIHHRYHEMDRTACASIFEKMKILFETAGAKNIEVPKAAPESIADRYTWHLMGTTRMGDNPSSSVLNKDCQFHNIKNLFVSDGSPFPSSGGLNPTLTIQALALRTASRILELSKKGEI